MAADPPQGRDHSLDCYNGRWVAVLIPRVVPCGAEAHIGGAPRIAETRSINKTQHINAPNCSHEPRNTLHWTRCPRRFYFHRDRRSRSGWGRSVLRKNPERTPHGGQSSEKATLPCAYATKALQRQTLLRWPVAQNTAEAHLAAKTLQTHEICRRASPRANHHDSPAKNRPRSRAHLHAVESLKTAREALYSK
jgi:hypothetical protein